MEQSQSLRIFICLNQLVRLAEKGESAKLEQLTKSSDFKELKMWINGGLK